MNKKETKFIEAQIETQFDSDYPEDMDFVGSMFDVYKNGAKAMSIIDKKQNLPFLIEMKGYLENSRTDVVSYEMLKKMITDWISELDKIK